MKYTLHHFTTDMDGNEPENNTSVGEFIITNLPAIREVDLEFICTHNNQVHKERWQLPSRFEAEEKIKTHLVRYFKSWETLCDV